MNNSISKVINYDALSYLKLFLSPDVKIVDLQVYNKWLRATLSSGIFFSVKNQSID